jgi:1,4-dihydroxy-6-naphthoate synthase
VTKRLIRIGHSPDPDDAFMFYAMTHGKLEALPFDIIHQLEDIETLNRRALRGELEVSAVSIHAYAHLTGRYALLRSGASMGDRYGPMLVTKQPFDRQAVPRKRIAVPGTLTTAFLVLSLYSPAPLNYTILPFDRIIDAVVDEIVDAGLIIHEGQLTYQNRGLSLVVDLGAWWMEETGCPLPLGGNVVRKDLGPTVMHDLARLLRDSIRYGLEHRREALDYAMQFARDMSRDLADRFIAMYVNDWTLDYGPRGQEAVRLLIDRGVHAGLIPGPVEIEFVA